MKFLPSIVVALFAIAAGNDNPLHQAEGELTNTLTHVDTHTDIHDIAEKKIKKKYKHNATRNVMMPPTTDNHLHGDVVPEEEVTFDPSSLDGGVGPIKKTGGGKDDEIESTDPIPSVSEFIWKMYFYILLFFPRNYRNENTYF